MDASQYQAQQRYTGKADSYARYRPGYPAEVVDRLRRACSLESGAVVADIGSGTGIFTSMLLEAGWRVYAVEPNCAMRQLAEQALLCHPRFLSIAASAENTGLPEACVDVIVCAQSFHWFDLNKVAAEFERLLRPGGHVFLIWNNQRFGMDAFHTEYEEVLVRHCPDYTGFKLQEVDYSCERLQPAFPGKLVLQYKTDNYQRLDLCALQGRVSSVSYCPSPASGEYAALMRGIERLFTRHQVDGLVTICYEVMMYSIGPHAR